MKNIFKFVVVFGVASIFSGCASQVPLSAKNQYKRPNTKVEQDCSADVQKVAPDFYFNKCFLQNK